MDIDAWTDRDVARWSEEYQDNRGKREKVWIREPNGPLWLRKRPRERSPSEPAIESLMLRLARASGLEAPESSVCTWRIEGEAAPRRGIVVQIFTNDSADLAVGSEVLRGADPAYDAEKKAMHSLDRVRKVLEALEKQQPGSSFLHPFARMLAFDAWIGNADRHQENWGVIHADGAAFRLAPMFDPASCLGTELHDGHANLNPETDLTDYVLNCPSGFGAPDESRLQPMTAVMDELSCWPEWVAKRDEWLAAFASAMDTWEERVLPCVSRDWLPANRAALACRLLAQRLEWLRRLAR